jgi:hypothetical protein
MAKYRKYSRKTRGQKRSRQASKKMRGGSNTPSFDETPESLRLSQLNDTISSNGSNNSQLPSFDNIEPIAPEEQFHLNDNDLNLDLSNDSSNMSNDSSLDNFGDSLNEGSTTFQSQDTDTFQSDSGSVDTIGSNNTTGSDVSLGGKLRKNKKKTNKRKSKKSKKTHKNKKRRQRGGIIL